ncbi:MAG: hypothetical protein ABI333_19490 [bacterium]
MRIRLSVPLMLLVLVGFGQGACTKKSKHSGSKAPLVKVQTSLPAPKLKAESVTFAKKMLIVGTVQTKSTQMQMYFTLKGPNGKVRFGGQELRQSREEILEVNSTTVNKIKVTFQKKSEVSKQDSKTKTKTSPLQGKTFIVETTDGEARVTDGAGKPVSEELTRLARKEYKTLGYPDRFHQNLPSTPLKPGQRVPALELALKQEIADENIADPKKKMSMTDPRVVFKGTEMRGGAKIAVFTQAMNVTIQEEGVEMVIHAQGYLHLRVKDGWKIGQEIVGVLDMMGQTEVGRIHVVETYSY